MVQELKLKDLIVWFFSFLFRFPFSLSYNFLIYFSQIRLLKYTAYYILQKLL